MRLNVSFRKDEAQTFQGGRAFGSLSLSCRASSLYRMEDNLGSELTPKLTVFQLGYLGLIQDFVLFELA